PRGASGRGGGGRGGGRNRRGAAAADRGRGRAGRHDACPVRDRPARAAGAGPALAGQVPGVCGGALGGGGDVVGGLGDGVVLRAGGGFRALVDFFLVVRFGFSSAPSRFSTALLRSSLAPKPATS